MLNIDAIVSEVEEWVSKKKKKDAFPSEVYVVLDEGIPVTYLTPDEVMMWHNDGGEPHGGPLQAAVFKLDRIVKISTTVTVE